jgi:hypothetical protein
MPSGSFCQKPTFYAQAKVTETGELNAANAENATDTDRGGGDEWGWLKVIIAGMVGAAGVLATQWITARTNHLIAREQAEISRSAVQVAADAAKASALGASAAVESAGAARESAAVAGRNAANLGVRAVARLRQDWINSVRNELSRLHSVLANYRPLPTKTTPDRSSRICKTSEMPTSAGRRSRCCSTPARCRRVT